MATSTAFSRAVDKALSLMPRVVLARVPLWNIKLRQHKRDFNTHSGSQLGGGVDWSDKEGDWGICTADNLGDGNPVLDTEIGLP